MNQFTVTPLGGFDPVGAVSALKQRNAVEDEQKRQIELEENRKKAFSQALDGTPESMKKLAEADPRLFTFMEDRNNKRAQAEGAARNEIKNQTEQNWFLRYDQALSSGDTEAQKALILEAEEDDNNDLEHGNIGQNPEMDKVITKAALFKSLGEKGYENLYGESKQSDLPAEAVAFNDLIKDFSPKEKIAAKRIKAGLKGRAMSNALLTSIENGSVSNLTEAKAKIAEAEKFASATGSSRAKLIDKGFENINKVDSGIRNIDKALAAVESGAGVGAVEKLWPSIKASSVELDNIRGQMALDVVGATTFGALSQGELDLAKDIALPTGLDTAELKDYLQRKKIAQQKLRDYYNEQIQFLDQGGTVAGFLRSKERSTNQGANQESQQKQLSDAELLAKYGG